MVRNGNIRCGSVGAHVGAHRPLYRSLSFTYIHLRVIVISFSGHHIPLRCLGVVAPALIFAVRDGLVIFVSAGFYDRGTVLGYVDGNRVSCCCYDSCAQNSRGFRVLKVWLALQQAGRERATFSCCRRTSKRPGHSSSVCPFNLNSRPARRLSASQASSEN